MQILVLVSTFERLLQLFAPLVGWSLGSLWLGGPEVGSLGSLRLGGLKWGVWVPRLGGPEVGSLGPLG